MHLFLCLSCGQSIYPFVFASVTVLPLTNHDPVSSCYVKESILNLKLSKITRVEDRKKNPILLFWCFSYIHRTLPFWHSGHQVCGFFPHQEVFWHQLCDLQFSEFWHCLPQDTFRVHRGKAQSHKAVHQPPFTPIISPDCYPCFWLNSDRSEVPIFFSLGSIHLLEH